MAWYTQHNWHRRNHQSIHTVYAHLLEISTIKPHFPLTEIAHLQNWTIDLIHRAQSHICSIKTKGPINYIWVQGPRILHQNTWIKITPVIKTFHVPVEPFTARWLLSGGRTIREIRYIHALTIDWYIRGKTGETF
uniref:Uncharacterized protein n=1 Tax=Walleye epidermal hyperplasia virus 1 TaxID=64462 RepID=Q9WHI5_9RETR|nr:unknown [Walleye epidermal hyperplasia virus 1]